MVKVSYNKNHERNPVLEDGVPRWHTFRIIFSLAATSSVFAVASSVCVFTLVSSTLNLSSSSLILAFKVVIFSLQSGRITRYKMNATMATYPLPQKAELPVMILKGVMAWSIVDALSELCSPFLKRGNSAFLAAIARGLFPQTEYRSLE